mmetsp:Transcript_35459/g.77047  ORF Transcript_35459/g.77047 Transcript_35459/m.77047 type:complete len:211 (-) Transcript_35459:200-832(-)
MRGSVTEFPKAQAHLTMLFMVFTVFCSCCCCSKSGTSMGDSTPLAPPTAATAMAGFSTTFFTRKSSAILKRKAPATRPTPICMMPSRGTPSMEGSPSLMSVTATFEQRRHGSRTLNATLLRITGVSLGSIWIFIRREMTPQRRTSLKVEEAVEARAFGSKESASGTTRDRRCCCCCFAPRGLLSAARRGATERSGSEARHRPATLGASSR